MKKGVFALVLSLLVTAETLAAPHKPAHRPPKPASSPIARFLAQITSILKGSTLSTGEHTQPPPPPPLVVGR